MTLNIHISLQCRCVVVSMIQGTVNASSFLNCCRRALQKPKRYGDHTVASHDRLHEEVHDRLQPRPRYIGSVSPNSKLTPPYIRLHPTQWQTSIRFLIAKTTPSENHARSAKCRSPTKVTSTTTSRARTSCLGLQMFTRNQWRDCDRMVPLDGYVEKH